MSRHQWKKETSWWDDLAIPSEEIKDKSVFTWLEANAPDPEEHDYVLYTDGSGCIKGWGARAAVITPVVYDADSETRELREKESTVLVSGTYGSTVQRCELTAFLDGIHEILRLRAEAYREGLDEAEKYAISQEGILSRFTASERITVLWYTDRRNIAEALLYDEYNDPLAPRSTERDLWMRYSAMARFVCITPMATSRNVVANQATCDTLCSIARASMQTIFEGYSEVFASLYPKEKWNQQKSQKAQF